MSTNIITVGDLNEDYLNHRNHLLKDVLLLNSLTNVISVPTRWRALLDSVIVPFEQHVLDCGALTIPPTISDHSATVLSIPFEYTLFTFYKRTVWLYSKGNYDTISENITKHNWNYLSESKVDDATKQFETDILTLAKKSKPTKEITVHRNDKPWYDSEIRKFSRIKDGLKSKAGKSSNPVHWQNIQNNEE